MIPIDISKELAYYADSKYIRFIKFSLTHQKLRAWENLSDFQKKGGKPPRSHRILMEITHHQIQRIKEPYCRGFKLISAKMWNFVILLEERSRMRVYLFFFFHG